ncbi:MAG: D-alanine--D-alanine ligase family protein [Nitrosotalea sp.]
MVEGRKRIGRTIEKTIRRQMHDTLTIGITFDTRNDFKFEHDDPWDWDIELQVSMSVDDISRSLEDLGHKTVLIGSGTSLVDNFSKHKNEIDLVFNIAEGKFGRSREGQVPALLEMAGIPFVGSDSYATSVAMNKWHTKIIGQTYGIRTAQFTVIENMDFIKKENIPKYPVIAKLCYEGSSMGLNDKSKIYDFGSLQKQVKYLLRTYKQPVLVEEFITGTEIDVPIIGNKPKKVFGVVGISLDDKDMGDRYLTSKIVYDDKYYFHYPMNASFETEANQMSLKMYDILGCRDFGRMDMRINSNGEPYLLEVHALPYIGKHSSFNYVAEKNGMKYRDMIGMILDSAIARCGFN